MAQYTIEFDGTAIGRQRFESAFLAIRNRGGSVSEQQREHRATFEDQKKEGRLLRKLRAIGQPKDWVSEVRKQIDRATDPRQIDQLRKVLESMERGDDPRVAEPEDGLPDTRDFVLRPGGGSITIEFDDRELLVKYLKATEWLPDWTQFAQDMVEYIAGVQGEKVDEEPQSRPRRAVGERPQRVG